MRDAAAWILEETTAMTFDQFKSDRRSQLVIERQFEILGEAARRLAEHDADTAARITGLRRSIGLRNVIAHGYDELDYARVWVIIESALPELHDTVCDLLEGNEP